MHALCIYFLLPYVRPSTPTSFLKTFSACVVVFSVSTTLMEKQQKFCAFGGSYFAAKNSKKRKERDDHQQVGSPTSAVSAKLPLIFKEYPSCWVKRTKPSSSNISAIAVPRIPGRELRLFDHENWVGAAHGSRNEESLERRVAINIKRMATYSPEDLQEERSRGVSTQLSLYHHDPFNIKKKMKPSDLGNLCRLLVCSELVEKHVFPFLNDDQIKQVEVINKENHEDISGLRVLVWDMDTRSMHRLVFKRWSASRSYVFNNGWKKDFVERRGLMEGDEIGLFWDTHHSRFHFSVVSRAAAAS